MTGTMQNAMQNGSSESRGSKMEQDVPEDQPRGRLPAISKKNKSVFMQIGFMRRLQQALDEGARAAVIRTALGQARGAGVEMKPMFSAVVAQGDALLPLIEALEAAVESGDVCQLREAIAQAEARGAHVHLAPARTALIALEKKREAEKALLLAAATSSAQLEEALIFARVAGVDELTIKHYESALETIKAMEEKDREEKEKPQKRVEDLSPTSQAEESALAAKRLRHWEAEREKASEAAARLDAAVLSRSLEQLAAAIEFAKTTIVSPKLIEQAEAVIAKEKWKEGARSKLQAAEQELLSNFDQPEALDVAIEYMQSVINEALDGGFSKEELAGRLSAIDTARKLQAARVGLKTAVAAVDALDPRTCPTEELVRVKKIMFGAVEAAREAGLSELEIKTPERLRRLLHNAVEDRKGAVRLYCRVRPLIEQELQKREDNMLHGVDSFSLVVDDRAGDREAGKIYSFDACWMPGSQEDVFEDTKDLVQSGVDGYNVTIFAYGQTGAGKTYTMYGGNSPETQGLCPRTSEELFNIIAKRADRFEFSVTLSMVELYCKRFFDLLDLKTQKTLKVRNQNGEIYIENALETPVENSRDILRLVEMGTKERRSRDTQMNTGSSRSHLFFCLKVTSHNRATGQRLCGKLLLVDLAGSERVKKSGVTGDGLKEASEINTSLSALSDVLQALVRNDSHVPYRNHELTQVLADSLGGSAKTLMFVNLSPAAGNLEESLMSLKYAQRAKGVFNDPTLTPSRVETRQSPRASSVQRLPPRFNPTPRVSA